MALERCLNAVIPVLLTANGSTEGVVIVSNTCGFYVKQQAILQAPFLPILNIEIKRVVSGTVLWVGPANSPVMTHRIDVSSYTVASDAFIYAVEQPKAVLPMESRLYASYVQEPSNSWRTTLVDCIGNQYDKDNPIPIVFDGDVNVGNVRVTACDNDPLPGDIHSSIRISDCTNDLKVNTDGSLNVNIVSTPGAANTVKNVYNEANSVVSGAITTLVQYTVPLSVTASILERISVSGENIAKFMVFVNSVQIDTRRTFLGSSLSEYFEFTTGSSEGFSLSPGDSLVVKVVHNRPYVGDFEGRIQVLEIM